MTFDFAFAMKVFAAMFAIMNPIADIPVLLSLTQGDRSGKATCCTGYAHWRCYRVCGVRKPWRCRLTLVWRHHRRVSLAGGLLVLLIALNMLHGTASPQHHPNEKEMSPTAAPSSVAIYRLTVPLLVGPGTISTLIVFGHTAATERKLPSLTIGLSVFLLVLVLVLAITLLSAPFIAKYLSAKAIAITQRLMGMILAAIAMEMMVSSLQAFFK
ncbi:MarC family protein [Caballeronia sp. INDeC2]|uniref:MarC family protein n=1 Tax=Caballeronia sp. INDeC2 TaxID=2921747 RepID=UPI00202805C9|nr:MarC family protein [Caballeronia sp. INDeC2]